MRPACLRRVRVQGQRPAAAPQQREYLRPEPHQQRSSRLVRWPHTFTGC
jgi:hypothetical protein